MKFIQTLEERWFDKKWNKKNPELGEVKPLQLQTTNCVLSCCKRQTTAWLCSVGEFLTRFIIANPIVIDETSTFDKIKNSFPISFFTSRNCSCTFIDIKIKVNLLLCWKIFRLNSEQIVNILQDSDGRKNKPFLWLLVLQILNSLYTELFLIQQQQLN